ncbi:hypothetical protein T484DRAFT_1770319, partial [Baffinella frigidus]
VLDSEARGERDTRWLAAFWGCCCLVLDSEARGERDTRWFAAFWGKLMRAAVEQMMQAADRATFVKGLLTADYPRLRALLLALWLTTRRESDAGRNGAVGDAERSEMLAALDALQNQHLTRAGTRITESVNALFTAKPQGSPAADIASLLKIAADIASLLKIVSATAQGSRAEPELAALVARKAAGALALFVGRCAEITKDAAEVRTLSASVSNAQARNLAVPPHP